MLLKQPCNLANPLSKVRAQLVTFMEATAPQPARGAPHHANLPKHCTYTTVHKVPHTIPEASIPLICTLGKKPKGHSRLYTHRLVHELHNTAPAANQHGGNCHESPAVEPAVPRGPKQIHGSCLNKQQCTSTLQCSTHQLIPTPDSHQSCSAFPGKQRWATRITQPYRPAY
jgi:hypothetical protein